MPNHEAEIAALSAEIQRLCDERARLEKDQARASVQMLRVRDAYDNTIPGRYFYADCDYQSLIIVWTNDCRAAGIAPDYLARAVQVVLPMADYIRRLGSGNTKLDERHWLCNQLDGLPQTEYTTRAALAAGWVKEGEQ